MKAYTDLEQSKKLAEILPIESADMHYNNGSCRGVDYTEHFSAELTPYQEALHLMKIHKTNFMFQVIPCWSLAALLDVIPVTAEYNDIFVRLRIDKGYVGHAEYAMWYDDLQTNLSTDIEVEAENFVDTCVEMILKLNELKLL